MSAVYHPRLSDTGMHGNYVFECNYGTHQFSYPLPNCTSYCMARCHELYLERGGQWSDITGSSDPSWFNTGPTFGNAENWYPNATNPKHGWTRSQTPQLGAIACWGDYNGLGGHVAVVEEIRSDGYVNMSQSHFGGAYFDTTGWVKPIRNRSGGGYPGRFQGYLVNPLTAGDTPGEPIGKKIIPFRRGQWVKIIQCGNANSYGTGRKAYGIGWKKQIIRIYEGRPFPYRVGDYGTGATTGFYKASALKKL